MTIDICGNPEGKRILLLPGTCCSWQTNFERLVPCLEKDYLLICVNYSGFDHTGEIFTTMTEETEKIEAAITKQFEGKIDLAYGSSLGGSFVGLLVQRNRISIAHAVIGSSDLDQMGRVSGWFYAQFVTAFLMKMVKNPDDNQDFRKMLQEKMGMDLGEDGENYLKNYFITLRNTDRKSIFNQFYSDLVTPLRKSIHIPGCRVHIMYAKRMGSKYLKRYRKHFADPDIHEFDMGHEGWLFNGNLMKEEFESYMSESAETGDKSVEMEEKPVEMEDKSVKMEDKSVKMEDKSVKMEDKSAEMEDKSAETEDKSAVAEEKPVKDGKAEGNSLTWVKEFSIAEDGFHGHLYRPAKDDFPGKALLVLGGGGMPYQSTLDEAEAFAGIGLTSLAVGYFGVPGAPKTIVRVPIEYVENAADRLHDMGFKTVIAVGISKGAELALAAASLLPQINAVIALAPSSRVYMGVGPGISWVKASSWEFRGKELPYAYTPSSGWSALWDSIRARELTFRPVYERANLTAGPESYIPVEQIQGPVLVVGATADSLWPSADACREITKRLNEKDFAYPHKQLICRYASHILLPFETPYGSLFRIGRKYPKKCKRTIHKLQEKILEWLHTQPS